MEVRKSDFIIYLNFAIDQAIFQAISCCVTQWPNPKSDTFLSMVQRLALVPRRPTWSNMEDTRLAITMLVKLLSAILPDDSALQFCHNCQASRSRFLGAKGAQG